MKKNLLALLMFVFLVGLSVEVFAYGEDGPPESTIGVNSANKNLNSAIVEGGNSVGNSNTDVAVDLDSKNQNIIEVEGNQTVIDFGGGDGKDKFNALLPGAYYAPTPTGPEIPLPLNGVWNYKAGEQVIAGFPTVVTRPMMNEYVSNKTFFIKDQSKKDELAENFFEAREKLVENANVVIFRKFKPSDAIRLSLNFPGENALEGRDYLKMGVMTFQTREGLEKWYKELKLENITSDDLMAMFLQCGMDIGANMVVPTGQGSETMFGTQAGAMNLGALFTAALGLAGDHALPYGGSLGSGAGVSSGSNKVKAEPFLSVAFLAIKNPNAVVKSPPVVEKKNAPTEVKNDNYQELMKCALPVADPNGKLRLLVAQESLEQYLASGKTDPKALDSFHLHLGQGIRDNIKGEHLKIAQEGVCLVWLERAKLVKQTDKKIDNLTNAESSMRKYRVKAVGSPEDYLSRLRVINAK
jgi:hypothetical protein